MNGAVEQGNQIADASAPQRWSVKSFCRVCDAQHLEYELVFDERH